MEITEKFRKTLYEVFEDYSTGNIQFGVLKTFYEDDVHVLYDELIEMIPKKGLATVKESLEKNGVKVFMMYMFKYNDAFGITSEYKSNEDIDCIEAAYWLNQHIKINMFKLLNQKSKLKLRIDFSCEGHLDDYKEDNTVNIKAKINEAIAEYGLTVNNVSVLPMRYFNKEELEEYNEQLKK